MGLGLSSVTPHLVQTITAMIQKPCSFLSKFTNQASLRFIDAGCKAFLPECGDNPAKQRNKLININ
jgi:hypothetical protein